MLKEGNEAALLEKAEVEEKTYNWGEAVRLYKQAVKSFLDKNMIERAAKAYKKLGYANTRAANTVDTSEAYLERNKYAINSYKKAANLFEQSGNNSEELECKAEAFFVRGISAGSIIEVKEAFSKANELFIKANELYSKDDDQESCARTLSRAAMASSYLFVYCSDRDEIKQVIRKGKEYSEKAWRISKEIGNAKYLVESLIAEKNIFIRDISFPIPRGEVLLKIEKYLTLVEDYNDFQDLGMIYTSAGIFYCNFGRWDVDQKEYIDKGLLLIEKGLEFARKTRDKSMILFSIAALNFQAIFADRYEYYQKRTLNDLNEMAKLSKIFTGIVWRFLPDNIACRYYLYLALSGFFTPTQRKSYAEKGIKHAIKVFELFSSLPSDSVVYMILTSFHSVLTLLATTKDEQDENAKKMLQYAKQAENFLKTFEGTVLISNVWASIYIAHRTLADIANSDKERIKMLTLAADVYEKNIDQATWVHTGKLGILIRLGRIYEEIGILTADTEKITKAKETFLSLIKETHKRDIPIFRALAYEHIARIEDRLGNHTASGENYEKAGEVHAESLKTIGYKPLIKRVKEKIEYTQAWNLIETAKTYHKSENHLKAKENYEKASKILENVLKYDYEAPYCAAWALLEEAEQLSKQEMLEEAIENYKTASKAFEEAIKTFEKAYKRFEEKKVIERIEKLEKVANIRINYCMARINLEKARILEKQGEHLLAAGKFTLAASQFRNVCTVYKIERERKELEAIYYLCRAWESMVLAEKYGEPDRFAEAANLFIKAGNLFTETKLKLLASGNSSFCKALEYGCKFDESISIEIKTSLYPKVKSMLRKAADSYRKGGFKSGADWALATSTHFDATWHLIRADEELDFKKKGDLLGIGSRYLKSAAELFGKAGHKDKEKDVQEQFEMVEREELIVLSALSTIEQPAISRSTTGIVAPACPLETSESPRMSEIQQIETEPRSLLSKRLEDFSEIYECDTNLNILHISDIQEGRFGIKEDISQVNEAYANFLSDLKDKLEILHRKNKIDIIVISGDLTSIGSEEEFNHLTNEFIPILNEVFLNGPNIVPKKRWIMVPGNHDVEWGKGEARFNNFIQFCQDNGFHQYKLNNPESIYSSIIFTDKNTGNTIGIIALNSCLDIFDENSPNISNISNSYFSSFSKDWDFDFREMPKLMVCHHTLHSIKKDKFNNALNKLSDNNVLLALAGDIHKSDSHADEISNIRCIPAGTILAKKTERQVGIDEVSRQFNLINLNLLNGYVKWYTYSFEGSWREIKNQSFNLEHASFSNEQ